MAALAAGRFLSTGKILSFAILGSGLVNQSQNDDGGGERDGGEEDGGASIVAGGDMSPVLQAADHDLDAAAASVAAIVVFDGYSPGFSARNAGRYALCLKGVPVPVCVVATVGGHPLCLGQIIQQRCSAGVIAYLASGREKSERATVGIGDGVELRIHAAFGATDQPPEAPFFTRRLDAVRCAFRQVASIMIVSGVALAAASPSIMRMKTPLSPHRFHRL